MKVKIPEVCPKCGFYNIPPKPAYSLPPGKYNITCGKCGYLLGTLEYKPVKSDV